MQSYKKVLFNFGGYSFWILIALWTFSFLLVKGCESTCYKEVVKSVVSPNGKQVAKITIGDCGGATANFWGVIDVNSENPKLSAKGLLGFSGHPEQLGLDVTWLNDNELVISFMVLKNVRHINPNGRKSAELKVIYEHRK